MFWIYLSSFFFFLSFLIVFVRLHKTNLSCTHRKLSHLLPLSLFISLPFCSSIYLSIYLFSLSLTSSSFPLHTHSHSHSHTIFVRKPPITISRLFFSAVGPCPYYCFTFSWLPILPTFPPFLHKTPIRRFTVPSSFSISHLSHTDKERDDRPFSFKVLCTCIPQFNPKQDYLG